MCPGRSQAMTAAGYDRAIRATGYRPVEVIVVDDRSSGAPAEIVERLTRSGEAADRLRLVRGEELPEGWFGKPWAIAQGYRVARGDLLLFTDADTWHHPELLPRTVTVLTAERADLVSVVARQEMVTFWERLVQPHVLVALASRVGELRRVNRTRVTWDAIASGAYILTTRRASAAAARAARRALLDVAAGVVLGAPAPLLGGVRLDVGCGDDARVAADLDRRVSGGGGAGALRAAISARGGHGGVHHDQVGLAGL